MTVTVPAPQAEADAGSGHSRFRTDIQGLRAAAVLAVIADHAIGWPRGGFVGVDIFFVVSGYLITGLLLKEYASRGSISAVGFYARRIRRIAPASVVVLIVTVLASYVVVGRLQFIQIWRDAAASLGMVANWNFIQQDSDYFQDDLPPSPLQHFWSLAVEEQFYLTVPWLMLGVLLLGKRFGRVSGARSLRVAAVVIAGIGLLSLGWAFYETWNQPLWAYFSTFSRVWELAAGALIAALGGWVARLSLRLRARLLVAGLLGIAVSLAVTPEGGGFPAPWALLPVASTVLVIMAGAGDRTPRSRLLDNRVSQYLGKISYSLYLWHLPVIVLLRQYPDIPVALRVLLSLVIMFGLAGLSYRLVEAPLRGTRWLPTLRSGSARTRLVSVTAAAAVVSAVALSAGLMVSTQREVAAEVAALRSSDLAGYAGAAALVRSERSAEGSTLPLIPAADIARFDVAPTETKDCMAVREPTAKSCALVDPERPGATVVLVGDSHARQWSSAFASISAERDWRLITYFKQDCGVSRGGAQVWSRPDCVEWGRNVVAELLEMRPDAVMTIGTRTSEDGTPEYVEPRQVEVWQELDRAGIRSILMRDNPRYPVNPARCAELGGLEECGSVPRSRALESVDPLSKEPGVPESAAIIDLSDYFCGVDTCNAVTGGVLVMRDTHHVTNTYIRTMLPYLREKLDHGAKWLPGVDQRQP